MPKVLALYHFYYPDDVAGAAQFTGLCEGLAAKGWEVEVWPSNRSCFEGKTFSGKPEEVNGVKIKRVWRPGFDQHGFGRILNSIWMLKAWFLRLLFSAGTRPDVILLGTDPLFSLFLAPWLKRLRRNAKIAHWCFDLYPEAAVADGLIGENSMPAKTTGRFMQKGYQACDLVADLGPSMAQRLKAYPLKKTVTLTPWALEEPEKPMDFDADERKALFGDSPLGLLYSGSFGRAHGFYMTLKLARNLAGAKAVFCYSARGSRLPELRKALNAEDKNFRFAPFAAPEKLAARLSAPDIHLVSLRPEWTGIVAPSKFFGALAVGRPVLFEGDENDSIAGWIREYGVGWVLHERNLAETTEKLLAFLKSPAQKQKMFRLCHETYQAHFSKKGILDLWDGELRLLIQA